MWIVYILYSKSTDRYNVGYAENIKKRLEQHNSGGSRSTKSGVPWIVKQSESFEIKSVDQEN